MESPANPETREEPFLFRVPKEEDSKQTSANNDPADQIYLHNSFGMIVLFRGIATDENVVAFLP